MQTAKQRVKLGGDAAADKAAGVLAVKHLFNMNTVESTLLGSCVFVCLSGIMFQVRVLCVVLCAVLCAVLCWVPCWVPFCVPCYVGCRAGWWGGGAVSSCGDSLLRYVGLVFGACSLLSPHGGEEGGRADPCPGLLSPTDPCVCDRLAQRSPPPPSPLFSPAGSRSRSLRRSGTRSRLRSSSWCWPR